MNGVHPALFKDKPNFYRIAVQGRLDESWSDWLSGMDIAVQENDDDFDITTVTGEVVDQAALHGILNRIRDLNLPLLSVQLIRPSNLERVSEDIPKAG